MAAKPQLLFETGQKIPNSKKLLALAVIVAKTEKVSGQFNVVFCSNQTVRKLNLQHRKLNKVTDVLSFPWNEPDFIGEIYIACNQVKTQAPRWKNNYFNELCRVLIHGVLHLCGYDHKKLKDRLIMRKKEEFYLKSRKNG